MTRFKQTDSSMWPLILPVSAHNVNPKAYITKC